MGVAFSSLWGSLFGSKELKICILGLDNAGKTTLMYKMTLGSVVSTAPTVGSNTEQFEYKNLKFMLWDVGGQTSLRTSWTSYLAQTDAVIFVLDSNDRERVSLARDELHKIAQDEQVSSAPILVWANKQDIKGAMTPAEISSSLALTAFRDRTWQIFGCSALTGKGLTEGLDWLAHTLGAKGFSYDAVLAHAGVEADLAQLIAQNRRTATPFTVAKHTKEAAKNWDKFYKSHADRFFKDRHWTSHEFSAQLTSSTDESREEETSLVGEQVHAGVLLEVGCGVGNMLYPLLTVDPQIRVHCCDFSARAVDMVRHHPSFDPHRVNAFVYDLTEMDATQLDRLLVTPSTADWPSITTISLIFVLSAIPPDHHERVLSNLIRILAHNGGGSIVFRDYALGDLSQIRYHTKKDAAWAEPSLLSASANWYRRGDNTFNYFFQQHELQQLADKLGLQGPVEILHRQQVNRRRDVHMERRFVQAKWTVQPLRQS